MGRVVEIKEDDRRSLSARVASLSVEKGSSWLEENLLVATLQTQVRGDLHCVELAISPGLS